MNRVSLADGTEAIFECPFCKHIGSAIVFQKTTEACERCSSPFEVYEDGRVEHSALMYARGPVYHGPPKGFSHYMSRVRTIFGMN